MFKHRLNIEDYFTNVTSSGVITMLEKTEVVNRLLNILTCNFNQFNFFKLRVEMQPVTEELEEYKDMNHEYQIQRVKAFYDGNQLDLKQITEDINYDTHLNTKVYSPVVGCPIDCSYCFSKKVVNHFGLCHDFKKPVFRGFYKITKDAEGNDVPELFNIENDDPIDWFLTYMSDFGCWKPEWQENVLQQIIAATNLKRKREKHVDTFQLVTKCPNGIRIDSIPKETDLKNVIFSCTVDSNDSVDRITELIDKMKDRKITASVIYQPVREHISPDHLDKFVETFGKNNSWVIVGGEVSGTEPFRFEWAKDIIDKCIELGIPVKMEMDIKPAVLAAGYEFLEQEPKIIRDAKAIRKMNLAIKKANVTEYYNQQLSQLARKLKKNSNKTTNSYPSFMTFGDVGITVESAKRLIKKSPDFDVILTVETKGIPIAYEMARQCGKSYIVARKSSMQSFCVDEEETALIRDKKVLIVDDIVSTGESIKALESLTHTAGGIIAGKVTVFAEGEATKRSDIIFLEMLPDE